MGRAGTVGLYAFGALRSGGRVQNDAYGTTRQNAVGRPATNSTEPHLRVRPHGRVAVIASNPEFGRQSRQSRPVVLRGPLLAVSVGCRWSTNWGLVRSGFIWVRRRPPR